MGESVTVTAILVADSAGPPTDAQIAAAKAAGVGAWCGYFSNGSDNILENWPDSAFQAVLAGGLKTLAFCSQLNDPASCKARAASLGIPICLDCESGIAPDNAATEAWILASGSGLYGGSVAQANHATHSHSFYVFAEYPGWTQTASWPPGAAQPSPARPMAWQWADNGSYGGRTVDLSNYDAAIFGSAPTTEEADMILIVDTPTEGVWALSGSAYFHIDDPETLTSLQASGACAPGTWTLDEGQHQLLIASSNAAVLAAIKAIPAPQAGAAGKPGPAGKTPSTATLSGPVKLAFSK